MSDETTYEQRAAEVVRQLAHPGSSQQPLESGRVGASEAEEPRLDADQSPSKTRGKTPPGGGNSRRYVDRELPVDLFSKNLRGELSLSEARHAARERWDDDEARGGSMNDLLRRQWEAQGCPGGRADQADATRDARGRFQARERAQGRSGEITMNDRIRERWLGPAAYGNGKQAS